MTPFVIALVALVGATLFLWEKAARADAEKDAKLANALARDLQRQLYNAWEELEAGNKARAFLRKEAEILSNELKTCDVPGAARERLARVLAHAAGNDRNRPVH